MKKLDQKIFTIFIVALSLTLFTGLSRATMGDHGNMPGSGYGPGEPGNQEMMGGGHNGNGYFMMGNGGPAMT